MLAWTTKKPDEVGTRLKLNPVVSPGRWTKFGVYEIDGELRVNKNDGGIGGVNVDAIPDGFLWFGSIPKVSVDLREIARSVLVGESAKEGV